MRKHLKQFLFEIGDFFGFVAVLMFIIIATLLKVVVDYIKSGFGRLVPKFTK